MSDGVEDYLDGGISWNADGSYTPFCPHCNYTGKARGKHADARAAVRQHECGTPHRRAMSRRAATLGLDMGGAFAAYVKPPR